MLLVTNRFGTEPGTLSFGLQQLPLPWFALLNLAGVGAFQKSTVHRLASTPWCDPCERHRARSACGNVPVNHLLRAVKARGPGSRQALVIPSPGRSLAWASLGADHVLLPLWLLVARQELNQKCQNAVRNQIGREAACTAFPAVGSEAKLFVNFVRKHVLRRFPFQAGSVKKSGEPESNFPRNAWAWIVLCTESGLQLLGPRVWDGCPWLIMGCI